MFVALVCSDIGRDLGKSTNSPWGSSHDIKFFLDPTPPANTSLQDGFFQKGPYLSHEHGHSLDPELMRKSTSYALSELFRFAASSELQFLDLLESRLALLDSRSPDSGIEFTSSLRRFLEILCRHEKQISDTIRVLENRGGPSWPTKPLQDQKLKELAETTEISLQKDYAYLHRRVKAAI